VRTQTSINHVTDPCRLNCKLFEVLLTKKLFTCSYTKILEFCKLSKEANTK